MNSTLKNKRMKALALLVGLCCAGANAGIIVTFGGQEALDSSGLTSAVFGMSADNQMDVNGGLFIETFDSATQMTDVDGLLTPFGGLGSPDQSFNYKHNEPDSAADDADCGINTQGAAGISVVGNVGVGIGNIPGVAANPGNGNTDSPTIQDDTCYGFTPGNGSSGSVTVDYTDFLTNLGGGLIDYLGFYWGSVDSYNDFTFHGFLDGGNGSAASFTLLGDDLLQAAGGNSGNQSDAQSNQYVNITFDDGFVFNKFVVTSDGIAGEFDNVVTGLASRQKVPEPASLAIFGLGLIGVALTRRKRSA